MRRIAAFLFVASLGCSGQQVSQTTSAPVNAALQTDGADTSEVAFNVAGAPTCEISVPAMMCEHGCAATVRSVLAQQPGVKEVKVDFASKTAIMAIDKDAFDAAATVTLLEDEYGFAETTLKDASVRPEQPDNDAVSDKTAADTSAG